MDLIRSSADQEEAGKDDQDAQVGLEQKWILGAANDR